MSDQPADGPVVLTERTDVLAAGRRRAASSVCGTFEVSGGEIVLWRDYVDWTTVLATSARGGVDAPVQVVRSTVGRSARR
ncbi:limonene-1,2-epoxide hydrolase [Prauserella isguenensis]|uniref:Limonene-1,2-epoxide hydrolase n=1 Tax=Prauserella isguenensis TaxID=1470180 RepID=A0A839RZR9_9PSEU|nr:limonene-1,2-epoxide hydrolase family protein [Prauserella isguenensis]MBB3050069.1 limonene-1,2-epoxide hydrolase [Prauserella isguenensis]